MVLQVVNDYDYRFLIVKMAVFVKVTTHTYKEVSASEKRDLPVMVSDDVASLQIFKADVSSAKVTEAQPLVRVHSRGNSGSGIFSGSSANSGLTSDGSKGLGSGALDHRMAVASDAVTCGSSSAEHGTYESEMKNRHDPHDKGGQSEKEKRIGSGMGGETGKRSGMRVTVHPDDADDSYTARLSYSSVASSSSSSSFGFQNERLSTSSSSSASSLTTSSQSASAEISSGTPPTTVSSSSVSYGSSTSSSSSLTQSSSPLFPPPPLSAEAEVEGWLAKKSYSLGRWRRRYARLVGNQLLWYDAGKYS